MEEGLEELAAMVCLCGIVVIVDVSNELEPHFVLLFVLISWCVLCA